MQNLNNNGRLGVRNSIVKSLEIGLVKSASWDCPQLPQLTRDDASYQKRNLLYKSLI
jgi:hypothetical protein